SVATVEAPANAAQPIRVAERPGYPSTGSFQSWSPAGGPESPSGAPPVAELMPPSSIQPGQK
ncbi:MAG: hypothetical protein KDA37_15050, partial [Planctomycetales bacterium]|nr:hypothetical protein [Planctomycetales bacterium]